MIVVRNIGSWKVQSLCVVQKEWSVFFRDGILFWIYPEWIGIARQNLTRKDRKSHYENLHHAFVPLVPKTMVSIRSAGEALLTFLLSLQVYRLSGFDGKESLISWKDCTASRSDQADGSDKGSIQIITMLLDLWIDSKWRLHTKAGSIEQERILSIFFGVLCRLCDVMDAIKFSCLLGSFLWYVKKKSPATLKDFETLDCGRWKKPTVRPHSTRALWEQPQIIDPFLSTTNKATTFDCITQTVRWLIKFHSQKTMTVLKLRMLTRIVAESASPEMAKVGCVTEVKLRQSTG